MSQKVYLLCKQYDNSDNIERFIGVFGSEQSVEIYIEKNKIEKYLMEEHEIIEDLNA